MIDKKITGFHLKMIAVITMLIDHIAAAVLWRYMVYGGLEGSEYQMVDQIYTAMRLIGRMAFPLYCFLLVEGFVHTSNISLYLKRMAVFAVLSEFPFDLAFGSSVDTYMRQNNVFWTLLLGLLAMYGANRWYRGRFVFFVVAAGLAELCHTDYGAGGVLAIMALYLLKDHKCTAYLYSVLLLSLLCGMDEIVALLMILPIYLYGGQKGPSVKYVFYVFYPVHLLILGCIGTIISGGM